MLKKSLIFFLFLAGCAQNPPIRDYTIAKTALEAAQAAGAPKFAPALWFKAEENYRQGEVSFKKGDFKSAEEAFLLSKDFSERAENKAKYDKKRLGEDGL